MTTWTAIGFLLCLGAVAVMSWALGRAQQDPSVTTCAGVREMANDLGMIVLQDGIYFVSHEHLNQLIGQAVLKERARCVHACGCAGEFTAVDAILARRGQ